MIFKFLNKPITIRAFINESQIHCNELYPIAPSSKFIPEWWKKLPKSSFDFNSFDTKNTTKSCLGIIGTFQTGYILPIWTDVAFQTSNDGQWRARVADGNTRIDPHDPQQILNFYENHYFFKIRSPWILGSSSDIKYSFNFPFYCHSEPAKFIVPYGIIPNNIPIPKGIKSNVKYITTTNIFLLVKAGYNEILINAGLPLLHIIPLTDKPINFKTEVLTDNEYKKYGGNIPSTTFSSIGLKRFKTLKEKEKKCPFNFL
jgi:hypothetical protein